MKINNQKELKAAILLLEQKNTLMKQLIKEDIHDIREDLRPAILFKKITSSIGKTNIASPVIDSSIGLAAGVLAKKAITGNSNNMFRKMAGTAAEVGIAKLIAGNAGLIKKPLSFLLKKIFKPAENKLQ